MFGWMSLRSFNFNRHLLVTISKLQAEFWLEIQPLILAELSLIKVLLSGTGLILSTVHKSSIEVWTLRKPFRNPGLSISQPALKCVWGHCHVGSQSFNYLAQELWGGPLLHYFIHFVQCTRSSKTASENDATTTMLKSSYSVLEVECLTCTRPNMPLIIVAKQINLLIWL